LDHFGLIATFFLNSWIPGFLIRNAWRHEKSNLNSPEFLASLLRNARMQEENTWERSPKSEEACLKGN
jgi:hypothetical protein